MFENLADSSDCRDKGESWMLDIVICDLLLVCKVKKKKRKTCALIDFAYFLGPETSY